MTSTVFSGRLRSVFWALGLVLLALQLRVPITSLGPVLKEVVAELAIAPGAAGLLTSLPPLCFGMLGPLAPALARRIGTQRAILGAMLILAGGMGLRGLATVPALFCGQILACLGIGLVNVLLPGVVKRDFPTRAAMMTGLYTTAMGGGSAIASACTVPLALMLGDNWTLALAFWALPALAAALFFALQKPPHEGAAGRAARPVRGLWTDGLAWQVTLFMGLQSALAYIVFGWLPTWLQDRGLTAGEAGFGLSALVLGQAPGSLLAPTLAAQMPDQRLANVLAVALGMVGLAGCAYGPAELIWLSGALAGVGLGASFALALTVILLRSPDADVAAHLSSMAQGIGYVLAALGPWLVRMLRSWQGNWDGAALFCLGIGVATAVVSAGAGRARFVKAKVEP